MMLLKSVAVVSRSKQQVCNWTLCATHTSAYRKQHRFCSGHNVFSNRVDKDSAVSTNVISGTLTSRERDYTCIKTTDQYFYFNICKMNI